MAVFIDSAFIAIGCISNKIPYVKCNIFIVLLILLIGYIIIYHVAKSYDAKHDGNLNLTLKTIYMRKKSNDLMYIVFKVK